MNRNDFYKELMSEYSFDSEKIKSNARKGRFARQKAIPLYIGITAAAAVCTVAVGTAVAVFVGGHGGVSLVESDGRAWLSADERLSRALEDIQRNENSTERREVLVSFTAAYSPAQAREILTGYSESVLVKQVYFADGTKAAGEDEVRAAFGGDRTITGAVINCEGALMKTLESDLRVLTVEEITDADMSVITPISTTGSEGVDVPAPDDVTPLPEYTTAPDTSADSAEADDGTAEDTFETTDGMDGTEESAESSEQASAESGDTAESEDSFETSEPPVTLPTTEEQRPVVVTPAEPELPTEDTRPADTATDTAADTLPDGVTLPENPAKFSYETYISADSAFFLTDNVFYVKSGDEIALYSYENGSESLIASESCKDAKICWVSERGGRLMVSAVGDEGRRSRLLLADAESGEITDLNAEDAVMDGTLAGVGYNESADILVMNIKEQGVYYVYTARLNGGTEPQYIATCFESRAKVTLLAAQGDSVYLAVTDGQLTQIYRCGIAGGAELIKTCDNSPVISKNLAFTHAVFAPSEMAVSGRTEIFDPATESFIRTELFNEAVSFGASAQSFSTGGSCYTISGGAIMPTEALRELAAIEYRKSGSALYAASAAGGRVKITESVYGKRSVTLGEFADVASAELRAAADRAIALNNALALGTCSDSGIHSQELLLSSINACYGKNAAAALMERCDISQYGALRYNGASLTAIRVVDTSLVITANGGSTAEGTLYVRTGSYCGKSGWYAYAVSFVKENGAWKLNSVLA